jgi:hypothetical protein
LDSILLWVWPFEILGGTIWYVRNKYVAFVMSRYNFVCRYLFLDLLLKTSFYILNIKKWYFLP